LRQVNAGFSPITFFTASGLQRNQGLEVEGFWTPMPNYQVALSFTNIYRSKTLANNSLAGATAYEILNTDRRLGYSPEYAVGLFNKYTFNRGALKGLSLAGGANGQTSTNPRYENAFDKPDFNPSYLVADITLGYAATVFGRRVNLTLNCNNVFDRLYEKGQFGYGEPRKITFRTDFNF
jgi:outer membrane receptor for ferric coprogen and ferric-rhodotorulic acid